jgi:hypothetical protein
MECDEERCNSREATPTSSRGDYLADTGPSDDADFGYVSGKAYLLSNELILVGSPALSSMMVCRAEARACLRPLGAFECEEVSMSQVPYIPENAPFTAGAAPVAQRLSRRVLLGHSRSWRNHGLESGLSPAVGPLAVLDLRPVRRQGLAKKAAKSAEAKGFAPKVVCMEKFESLNLSGEENVLLITSTYGRRRTSRQCAGILELVK